MPKAKEPRDESKGSSRENTPPILLNRTRARLMVPKPRVGKSGNPQKYACDILSVHPGLNRPPEQSNWDVMRASPRMASKLEGEEPLLRQLESVSEIAEMSVEMVLSNCSDRASVEWWRKVEKRPRVQAKIDTWLKELDRRIEKRFGKRPAA